VTAVSTVLTSTTRAQEPTGFLNRAIEVEGVSHRYQVYVPAGYTAGILQTSIGLGEGSRRHAERWQLCGVGARTVHLHHPLASLRQMTGITPRESRAR